MRKTVCTPILRNLWLIAIITLPSLSTQAAQAPLAAYAFDDGSGSTAKDASANHYNAVLSAASWTSAGKYAGALSFNGTSSSVSIGYKSSGFFTTQTDHDAITVEAWIKPTVGTKWQVIYQLGGSGNSAVLGLTDAGRARFLVRRSPLNKYVDSPSALPLGVWTHIAGVHGPTTGMVLYINGQPAASSAGAFTWRTGDAGHGIGRSSGSESSMRGINLSSSQTEWFNGLIDEVRVYGVALTQAEVQQDQSAPITIAPGDALAPQVSISSPANNSQVSGTVTLSADASDNVGVAGVKFLLNGGQLGAEDTQAPFTLDWNTTTLTNGSQTIGAEARDAAGNKGTAAPVLVNVLNQPSSAQIGQWGAAMNWPLVAVHASLLNTGELLLWDGWEASLIPKLWNPKTNIFTDIPVNYGVFCSDHVPLANGNILVAGGHEESHGYAETEIGIKKTTLFMPGTKQWQAQADLNAARWYATNVLLGDGRVAIIGGLITPDVWADTPEIFNPVTNQWTWLSGVNTSDVDTGYYLHVHLLPDGRVFVMNPTGGQTRFLDVDAQTWTAGPALPFLVGSTAMYRPGKILMSGGGFPDQSLNAINRAAVLDLTQNPPSWREIAPMAYPRYYHNLVLLPDGKVLAVGGSTIIDLASHSGTLPAEIWDPATETWTTLASMRDPRMYHSTALLLPDGRVLAAGGGRLDIATDYFTAEIYSPPYLFKGARPVITSAPISGEYGETLHVQTPDAAAITAAAMIPLGSVTHALDSTQRYVPLSFTKGSGELLVTLPANRNLATPGYYMLFLLNGTGIPSEAATVQLRLPVFKANHPDGVTLTAQQTSGLSNGWASIGSDRFTWFSNEWLEYQVDLDAGGSWSLGMTATNYSEPSAPGLPPGFTFNMSVSVDGIFQGVLAVPTGAIGTYQTGTLPLNLTSGVHTVRFHWTNDAWTPGLYDANLQVKSVSFTPGTVAVAVVETPTISPPGGDYTDSVSVALATTTVGAVIRYTIDGSTPSTLSPVYTAPFTLTHDATVSAKAYKTGMTESLMASAVFEVDPAPAPTPSGQTLTASQASNRSGGWSPIAGTDLYSWGANQWLEYAAGFGTGGVWNISLTATNFNSPGLGLSAGYAYNINVSVDGVVKGSFKVPGSTNSYQTGSMALSMPAGTHVVRFTWTNDSWSAGQFDANIQVKEVNFTPQAVVPLPPPITLNAVQTANRSANWYVVAVTALTSWGANEWLEYAPNFATTGNWTISLSAKNNNSLDAPGLPPGYAFNITVTVDGVWKGSFNVPGSISDYLAGQITLPVSAGTHTVRLTWTNDAWSQGKYDANIQVKEVAFIPN